MMRAVVAAPGAGGHRTDVSRRRPIALRLVLAVVLAGLVADTPAP